MDAPESALVEGTTVAEALSALAGEVPQIRKFVLDDQGRLRRHVNVFVNEAMVRDRERLSDCLADGDRVHILAAVSGGAGEGDPDARGTAESGVQRAGGAR